MYPSTVTHVSDTGIFGTRRPYAYGYDRYTPFPSRSPREQVTDSPTDDGTDGTMELGQRTPRLQSSDSLEVEAMVQLSRTFSNLFERPVADHASRRLQTLGHEQTESIDDMEPERSVAHLSAQSSKFEVTDPRAEPDFVINAPATRASRRLAGQVQRPEPRPSSPTSVSVAGEGSVTISRPVVRHQATRTSLKVSEVVRYDWISTTGDALLSHPCVNPETYGIGSVYVHKLVDRPQSETDQETYQLWVCVPADSQSGRELAKHDWVLAPSDPQQFPHPDPNVALWLRYIPSVGRPSWVLKRSQDRYRQKKGAQEVQGDAPVVLGGRTARFSED